MGESELPGANEGTTVFFFYTAVHYHRHTHVHTHTLSQTHAYTHTHVCVRVIHIYMYWAYIYLFGGLHCSDRKLECVVFSTVIYVYCAHHSVVCSF